MTEQAEDFPNETDDDTTGPVDIREPEPDPETPPDPEPEVFPPTVEAAPYLDRVPEDGEPEPEPDFDPVPMPDIGKTIDAAFERFEAQILAIRDDAIVREHYGELRTAAFMLSNMIETLLRTCVIHEGTASRIVPLQLNTGDVLSMERHLKGFLDTTTRHATQQRAMPEV